VRLSILIVYMVYLYLANIWGLGYSNIHWWFIRGCLVRVDRNENKSWQARGSAGGGDLLIPSDGMMQFASTSPTSLIFWSSSSL